MPVAVGPDVVEAGPEAGAEADAPLHPCSMTVWFEWQGCPSPCSCAAAAIFRRLRSAEESVLDEAGFVPPPPVDEEDGPVADAQVEEFRAFLESVTPEDFEG